MAGLPSPPGGPNVSEAFAVSTDSTTVVGVGRSASGSEAFRWVNGVGTQGLGDLPGGAFTSEAYAVSADGSLIVGGSTSQFSSNPLLREEAFLWKATDGLGSLWNFLALTGTDLSHWSHLTRAQGLSDDGRWVVGFGINILGETEAFRIDLSPPAASVPEGGPGLLAFAATLAGLLAVRRWPAQSEN